MMLSQTDIQNFYGNSTYMSLMEHLKELHPKEIQAFVLEELHIYGNSRIGMLKLGMNIVEMDESGVEIGFEAVPPTEYFGRNLGQKRYELSNHLGNTLVTVTDKKVYVDGSSGIEFEPEITTISDYYPYGAPIASRAYSIVEYRYGFNGQELENEINGDGNVLSATFWEYDTRLARRWNIDPVDKEFVSSYACFAGNPILMSDPNGDDAAGAIVGAAIGGASAAATGYLFTRNAPESKSFAMIVGGVVGGAIGGLAGSFSDIGPDITKAAKAVANFVVENQDVWLAGYLNYKTNRYKEQSFSASLAYFAIGAGGRAFTKFMPGYLERVTGMGIGDLGISENMAKALFNMQGMGIAAVGNLIVYHTADKDNYDDHGRKDWQFALIGATSVYSGGMLHKKLNSKSYSKPSGFFDKGNLIKTGAKGLEYGLLNYANAIGSSYKYMVDRPGWGWYHLAVFTIGFANGAIQAQFVKTDPKIVNMGFSYVAYNYEYGLTSYFIYLDEEDGSNKTNKAIWKKQSTIVIKSILFNQ